MKNKIKYITAVIFILQISSCSSQQPLKSTDKTISFCKRFNTQFNDANLLLSCIVYSKKIKQEEVLNSRDTFISIAGYFQSHTASGGNNDSLIEEFIKQNKEIKFDSDSSIHSLHSFIENYDIVVDLIFSKITSDDDVDEMRILEKKILKLHDLAIMYRSYIIKGQDLSSLTSAEGIALNVQIAYYLYLQDEVRRNEIIKNLL